MKGMIELDVKNHKVTMKGGRGEKTNKLGRGRFSSVEKI
jgi:hypothetical protein